MKLKEDNKIKNMLFVSFIYNLLLLFLFLVVFNCSFESNDDFIMKVISSGGYGIPDEHIVFINVIIGYILKCLYMLTNKIPWYELLQYLFIYFSLVILTFVFLVKNKDRNEKYFKLFVIFLLSYYVYVNLQFTKTSAILAVSGYIMIIFSIYESNKKMSIVGIILIFLASLMRFKMFLSVSTICSGLFIPIIIRKFSFKNDTNNNAYFNLLMKIVIISFCFVMIGQVVDRNAYKTDEWIYYESFNKYRAELYDDGFPDYNENVEVYEKLNINENALYLYRNSKYNDSDKFNLNSIIKLCNIKKDFLYKFNIFSLIDDIYYFFIGNNKVLPYTMMLVAIILCYLMFNKKIDYAYLCISILLLVIVSLISYFIKNNSFNEKVFIMYMLVVSLLLLYKLEMDNINKINIVIVIWLMLAFISSNAFINSLKISNYNEEKKEIENDYENILAFINSDKDNFYIFRYDIDRLFKTYEFGYFSNIIQPGNWITNAAFQNRIEENYNIDNLFKDIVGNDTGYIVENTTGDYIEYIDNYVQYINDYYCEDAYSEKVFSTKYYSVYRVLK